MNRVKEGNKKRKGGWEEEKQKNRKLNIEVQLKLKNCLFYTLVHIWINQTRYNTLCE